MYQNYTKRAVELESVGVEDQTNTLENPFADVLVRGEIGFEDETDAHRISSIARDVDRTAKRILQSSDERE